MELRTLLDGEWRLRRDRDEPDVVRLHHPERFAAVRKVDDRNLALGAVALFDLECPDTLRKVGLPEKVPDRNIGSFGIDVAPAVRTGKGGKLEECGEKRDIFHCSRFSGLKTPFLRA